SWRLTAPLRRGKRTLRRARRAPRRFRRPAPPAAPDPGPTLSRDTPLVHRPLVSIVTPVHDVDPEWLGRAVESVRTQTYPHWQLCLADDGSANPRTLEYLRSLDGDPAIAVSFGEAGGISAASNRALALAEGELVAFLDHDDELDPDALLECVRR